MGQSNQRVNLKNLKNDPEILRAINVDEWNNIPVPVCKAISDIINELLVAIQLITKNETELGRQNMVQTNMKQSLTQEIIRKYD